MAAKETSHKINYLLAIDGSEHASAAVTIVSDLVTCQEEGARNLVTLLAVFTPLQVSDLSALQQVVDMSQQFLQKNGVEAVSEVILGYPAEKILEYADKINPELIVMGAKGLRSTIGILLGGVVQQVVEYGRWPVLVVRAPYKRIKKVLVAVDGSRCSQKAIEFISQLSICKELDITLAHVLPPAPIRVSPEFYASLWPIDTEYIGTITTETDEEQERWVKEEEANGLKLLQNSSEILTHAGLKANLIQMRGDAATELITYADNNEIDLIVTGSRGLNPVKGWLLGSVSRKLVHYSKCSVLLVRDTICSSPQS